jgi:transcriptional regulator with XRE-family HTH domain
MGKKPGSGLPPSGFGEALRRVRGEKGLTQREVAETAAIHSNTVAKMERGEVEPSWQVVLAISRALGVDCTEFADVVAQPPGKPAKKGQGK